MTRSILIYANCQGEELAITSRYMQSFTGQFGFKWIPLHLVGAADWQTRYTEEFMADVVMAWEQVETGPVSPHRAALHDRLPKNCPVVRFPPLSNTCLWPFAGNDPRVAADPGKYPWPDSIAAVLANETLPDDTLFDKYCQITTERMPDLDRRLRLDIARWQAADAIADIKLADWVTKTFRSTNLFYTSGHIAAPGIAVLLKSLIKLTSVFPPGLMRSAISEVDVLLRHHRGQDFESVPIHPLVAEKLDLRFHDKNATYRWHQHRWTFRQYILHYIRWANYIQ